MTGKNKRKKRQKEIVYLLLSIILFFVNCLCSFHVMASITGAFSGLDTGKRERVIKTDGIFNHIIQINRTKTVEIKEIEEETDIKDINVFSYIDEEKEIDDEVYAEIQNLTDTNDVEWRYRLTDAEVKLVAVVAMLEDKGAMEAISEVILNRLESGKFNEDTVDGIIYAKGQFYVAKHINNITASDEAIEAALSVFRDGVSVVGNAEFFAEKSVKPEKIAKGLYLIDSIGNTNFYGQK